MFFVIEVNPGITLDQFALAVELEDNYQTDSYDLEYPGLIMTIRFFSTKNLHLGSEEGYPLNLTPRLTRDSGFHLLQTYL